MSCPDKIKGSSAHIRLLLSRQYPHQNLKCLMDCWPQECTERQLKGQVNNILTELIMPKNDKMCWCFMELFANVMLFQCCKKLQWQLTVTKVVPINSFKERVISKVINSILTQSLLHFTAQSENTTAKKSSITLNSFIFWRRNVRAWRLVTWQNTEYLWLHMWR